MSSPRFRQSGMPDRRGLRYYPASWPAGPWVVPLFWLTVLLLAGLWWSLS